MGKIDGKKYLNHVAYDTVVFGFAQDRLQILLMEYHNTGLFALPGGFVGLDEDLDAAVKRGLFERTGLSNIYLEQFFTFGSARRNMTGEMEKILQANNLLHEDLHWMLGRFISVGYFALIDHTRVNLQPDILSDSCKWYNIHELPELIQDHNQIVKKAHNYLRNELDRRLPAFQLLGEKFSMNELQKVYEGILGEKLHRGSFQRKMLNLGNLTRHEKQFNGQAHKAPFLYSFIQKG